MDYVAIATILGGVAVLIGIVVGLGKFLAGIYGDRSNLRDLKKAFHGIEIRLSKIESKNIDDSSELNKILQEIRGYFLSGGKKK